MKRNEINALVRKNIASLCPYYTARDEYQGGIGIFLDANESPYENGFNRYPDPHQKSLKARLGQIKGMATENIFLGNGSDEAIDLIFRIFCNPGIDNAVAIAPSYGMYGVAAGINDIELREVQLGNGFSLPTDELLKACDAHTKAIFLCSPNNPSGNAFPREDLLRIIDSFRGMVVVDEAYIDFSSIPSLKEEVLERPNLIVLQTLSKAWGMAGLRLGMAFADEYVIRLMSAVKYPYNINKSAQDSVLRLLEESVEGKVRETVSERTRVARELEQLSCVQTVFQSEANFLLVKVNDADSIYGQLIEEGIIVRNRSRIKGCESCLRITIGTREENDRLLSSLRTIK